jgi:hypothetical protein
MVQRCHPVSAADSLSNTDLVVYVIALLGGDSAFIHTEDVAVKCHELRPASFSWTKYPEYPNLDATRRALISVRSEKLGCLVDGRSGQGKGRTGLTGRNQVPDGWRLTRDGLRWLRSEEARIAAAIGSKGLDDRRQKVLQQLRRVFAHATWRSFEGDHHAFSPSIGQLAELMRVRVDAPGDIWESRFEELEGKADLIDNPELRDFVQRCRSSWKSGGTARRGGAHAVAEQ